jgi:phosphoribosylformylglycinamidine synthase
VACGGFSYGDVLGAGLGWARTILIQRRLPRRIRSLLRPPGYLRAGRLQRLPDDERAEVIIPGADHWPRFPSQQGRAVRSPFRDGRSPESPSLFFAGMAGSQVPIVVSHGEGGPCSTIGDDQASRVLSAMRYLDNKPASRPRSIPYNPNGSPGGLTGVTTADGRFTIMMPHPERCSVPCRCRGTRKTGWGEDSPWMRMFRNARRWVNKSKLGS